VAIVKVSEEEDTVTLEGQMGSREVRETLKEIAEDQPDVVAVINTLEVKPGNDGGF
jgi:osmotically-inducible protein OsmY